MDIYVGNLPYSLSENELRDVFAKFGQVGSVRIVKDRENGRSKGYGFVEMDAEEAGRRAISELDGMEVKGRQLKVGAARPKEKTSRPPRRPAA